MKPNFITNQNSLVTRRAKNRVQTIFLVLAICALNAPSASANLINAPAGIVGSGVTDSLSEIENLFPLTTDLLYKAEYDDGDFDKEESDVGLEDFGPSGPYFTITDIDDGTPNTADVSWNLSSTPYILTAVAWMSGGGWAYSGVAADQTKTGGPHGINTTLISRIGTTQAISHISFYGYEDSTSLPDGGTTLLLLGSGLAALALLSRRIRA